MYLQDDIGAGVPTQMMARRSAIEQGALFEKPEGIWSAVDSLWAMRVLQHGDSLHINAALCERHQGEHESITNMIDQSALDREFEILRSMQLPMIDPSLRPPSLSVVTQMLKLIRAATRVKNRRPLAALGLACQAWHPAAWRLALEWYCRRGGLAGTSRIPRYALDDAPIAALLRDTLPPTATAASPRPAVRPAPVSLSPDLGLPASA